jgi:hypothetical protein
MLGPLLAVATLIPPNGAAAVEPEILPVLARVGPWPVVSRQIGFQGRLWFANSVKGRNHNSADIYSLGSDGEARYETHLFSQDAGKPLVAASRLYWPFEDPRSSLDCGDFLATDGNGWTYGTIPTAVIYHVHALAESGRRLVAATSAWRAGLHLSGDGGRSWRQVYDHPTPKGRVTRIVDLMPLGDRVLAYLTSRDDKRVLRLAGDAVGDLPGWPAGGPLRGWTLFEDGVIALLAGEGGTAVWRSDGDSAEELAPPRPDWNPRHLAAGAGALWAVTGDGRLWRSPDGRDWRVPRRLEGGRPHEVAVFAGRPYVGGAGDDGRGILWGEALTGKATDGAGTADPPSAEPSRKPDWAELGEALDWAITDVRGYEKQAGSLCGLVAEAARAGPPDGFFESRWNAPWPDVSISLVGGATRVTARELGRWILLWGMALAGKGRVPVGILSEPWTTPVNRAEKYFAILPAALWTIARTGQNDIATLDALIARLDANDDPLWLTGDVVGALTAVTGRRFAYDRAAWRAWWVAARAAWPD